MAEWRTLLADDQLEVALRQIGREIAYPPTPPIAEMVAARLVDGPRPLRRPVWRWLLTAAAVLLVVLVGLLAAVPSARTAIADRLGLRGVDITHLPFRPTATPAGLGLGLGEPTTLAALPGRVAFRPIRPTLAELGEPEVYVFDAPPGGRVSLLYRGGQLLMIQFRGDFDPAFLMKGLGPGTRLEEVAIGGRRGYWIDGEPHFVLFRAADGQFGNDQIRLAGSVLLWEQDDLTLRLEGERSKDEAVRIASSVEVLR